MSIYGDVIRWGDRYANLRGNFVKFHEIAASLPTSSAAAQSSLCNLSVGALPDDVDSFDVKFAGAAVRFAFSYRPNKPNGAPEAFVSARKLDRERADSTVELGSVSFNGQGETELNEPRSGDVVFIADEVGAWHVVVRFVHAALGT
jgi:hypothetical protein